MSEQKRPYPPDVYSDGMLSLLIDHVEQEARYARERADHFAADYLAMLEEQARRKGSQQADTHPSG